MKRPRIIETVCSLLYVAEKKKPWDDQHPPKEFSKHLCDALQTLDYLSSNRRTLNQRVQLELMAEDQLAAYKSFKNRLFGRDNAICKEDPQSIESSEGEEYQAYTLEDDGEMDRMFTAIFVQQESPSLSIAYFVIKHPCSPGSSRCLLMQLRGSERPAHRHQEQRNI